MDWRTWFRSKADAVGQMFVALGFARGAEPPPPDIAFRSVITDGYKGNPVVFACVRLWARCFSMAPLCVYSGDDVQTRTKVKDHALRKLIRRPNDLEGEKQFWQRVITTMMGGVAYIWIRRDATGAPAQLFVTHGGAITPIPGTVQAIDHYRYRWAGHETVIAPSDMFRLPWAPDPLNPLGGVGPLVPAARWTDIDNEQGKYLHNVLFNDATPRTIIKVRGNLGDPAKKALKEKFAGEFGGAGRGSVGVFEGGDNVSVERLGMNFAELDITGLAVLPETRISAAFEVPALLANLYAGLERATYANAETMERFFMRTSVRSRMDEVASAFASFLLAQYPDSDELDAGFDVTGIQAMQEDPTAVATRAAALVAGSVIMRNEGRRMVGEEPDPDGDVYFIPSTWAVDIAGDGIVGEDKPEPEPVDPATMLAAAAMRNGQVQPDDEYETADA